MSVYVYSLPPITRDKGFSELTVLFFFLPMSACVTVMSFIRTARMAVARPWVLRNPGPGDALRTLRKRLRLLVIALWSCLRAWAPCEGQACQVKGFCQLGGARRSPKSWVA